MNNFYAVDVSYLRPSRTIETIILETETKQRILYVYNYDGYFFRVFFHIIDIMNFFEDSFEPEISFESEEKLDDFLRNVNLESEMFEIKMFGNLIF